MELMIITHYVALSFIVINAPCISVRIFVPSCTDVRLFYWEK